MAIKTSKDNSAVVRVLTNMYGFPHMHTIARIAINYSIQLNKIFSPTDFDLYDNGGQEYSEDTLFGGRDNNILYRALFNQHYERILSEAEFLRFVKIHLDFGLEKLKADILDSDRGRNAHIDYLLSIIKRGTNLIADERSVRFEQPPQTKVNIANYDGLIDFDLGNTEGGSVINIRLNDLNIYESHHIAIAGTTGSGKTELIKDILYQISQKTNKNLKFIFFDYKGEGHSEKLKPFLGKTDCQYINPLEDAFKFNPLGFIHLTNEKYQTFHINSFVDAVAAIETKLGAKQRNLLKTITSTCFDKKKKEGKHPTLKDIFEELKDYYEEIKESPDTLYAIMQDLSSGIFDDNPSINTHKIYEKSLYVSLPEALSEKLRQLCVFLTLKYLLSEFTSMSDVTPNEQKINPLRYVIVIDEAHVYLNNKNARGILQQLLRVIRSKGVVVIMLSQGAEDYYKPDFDFASQVKIPICLYVKNKQFKQIERFVGTAKQTHKLQKAIDDLDKGKGLINIHEPTLFNVRQFWKTIN